MNDGTFDAVVIGAGVGGVAAALAIARAGRTAVLVEECDWIGGQLTSQAVPPDEHGWIEQFGCTASYRDFRQRVRAYYRSNYPLLSDVRDNPKLNPGNGWVSPLCHEPRVALAVLESMIAPYLSSGRLRLLTQHQLVSVQRLDNQFISSVTVRHLPSGQESTLAGSYFLDASENGDLLPLAEIEYVTGSESRSETSEPSAGDQARPDNVQAFSICFAMEHRARENHIIPEPEDYSKWRSFEPNLTPPWPGPLLGWKGLNPRTMESMEYHFNPHRETLGLFSGLWAFRRLIDRAQFEPGSYASDLCLVNWPMIDYLGGDLITCGAATRKQRIQEARQLSLSFFYWLQTEAPRPDGGFGWPGLRLRGDIVGTIDGLAKAPYIREARRIRAETTIREQDVSATLRQGDMLGERYEDSIGIGYYRIDLHPTTGGDNYIDVPSLPFRIPLGALIPVHGENVLPAAKNIGSTHITNGCYRLHPVEWNIGESCGMLVAFCLENGARPREVRASPGRRAAFQKTLRAAGVELEWPETLNLEDGDPHAHARVEVH